MTKQTEPKVMRLKSNFESKSRSNFIFIIVFIPLFVFFLLSIENVYAQEKSSTTSVSSSDSSVQSTSSTQSALSTQSTSVSKNEIESYGILYSSRDTQNLQYDSNTGVLTSNTGDSIQLKGSSFPRNTELEHDSSGITLVLNSDYSGDLPEGNYKVRLKGRVVLNSGTVIKPSSSPGKTSSLSQTSSGLVLEHGSMIIDGNEIYVSPGYKVAIGNRNQPNYYISGREYDELYGTGFTLTYYPKDKGSVAIVPLLSVQSDPQPTFVRTISLSKDSTSNDVMQLQHFLNLQDPTNNLKVDGILGPLTSAALKSYQEQQGLESSGEIDEDTRAIINSKSTLIVSSDNVAVIVSGERIGHGMISYGEILNQKAMNLDGVILDSSMQYCYSTTTFQNVNKKSTDSTFYPSNVASLGSTIALKDESTSALNENIVFTEKGAMSALGVTSTGKPMPGSRIQVSSSSGRIGNGITETGLEGLRSATVNEVTSLAEEYDLHVTITGGTEQGHSIKGTFSHDRGYKVDLRLEDDLNEVVSNFPLYNEGIPRKSDNSVGYVNPATGSIYWREGNHWDVEVDTDLTRSAMLNLNPSGLVSN